MADSGNCLVWQFLKPLILLLVIALVLPSSAACYNSIFSFGDSYADTGNLYYYSSEAQKTHCFFPPYGETYFHHSNGRCSDGRLVVDFIAESFGLPLLKPYLGVKKGKLDDTDIERGVNFAVIGATALDNSFFQQRGIHTPNSLSLAFQLEWFKELLPTLCHPASSCQGLLGNSLFLVGAIGGNDFSSALSSGKTIEEIQSYVPHIINAITAVINVLIDLGGVTFIVPGSVPKGCMPVYLTLYRTPHTEEYDEAGCIKWLNNVSIHINQQLQASLDHLQLLHTHTTIIYADYFSAIWDFFHKPKQFGFTGSLASCCGGGGLYNYNSSAECGFAGAVACDDPSGYVGWDGIHLTEAAYKWIAKGLLDGSYTNPKIDISCLSNKCLLGTPTYIYPWK